ncbi:hypothetical protein PM082_014207 [Marasmius tenuissimus]|nr:hypothetical protein PM082_014207 [Marasmius tenuissimus]
MGRIGELGAHYPDIAFIVEGETSSSLGLLPNGLTIQSGVAGSGRYIPVDTSGETSIYTFTVGLDDTFWFRVCVDLEMGGRQSQYDLCSGPSRQC